MFCPQLSTSPFQKPPSSCRALSTHHQILVLEGTNVGSLWVFLLSLQLCPENSAEGRGSGLWGEAVSWGWLCLLFHSGCSWGGWWQQVGMSISGGRYPFLRSTATAAGSGEGVGHAVLIIVLFGEETFAIP